eukprot:gene15519-6782_t
MMKQLRRQMTVKAVKTAVTAKNILELPPELSVNADARIATNDELLFRELGCVPSCMTQHPGFRLAGQEGGNACVFTGVSSEIQNDLIDCIDSVIQDVIDKEVKECTFLSMQVDETTDVTTKEQLSVIIRLDRKDEIVERFLSAFSNFTSLSSRRKEPFVSHSIDIPRPADRRWYYRGRIIDLFPDTDAILKRNAFWDGILLVDGVQILSPESIKDHWFERSEYFPDLTLDIVQSYRELSESTKAFKEGKNLLNSGHVKSVLFLGYQTQ